MIELTLACILDILLGDPSWLPHPVVGIGKLISSGENFLRPRISNQRLAGILLVIVVVGTSFGLTALSINIAAKISPLLGKIVSILLIFTTLSLRSLERAAYKVYEKLRDNDLPGARLMVSHLVGRDTEQMTEGDAARSAIESVAESTTDGVVSPFFYALLGGAPLAMAYKAVNTMDSMIGHRSERYLYFGWAAARLDDLANYIPARLNYLLIPLAAGCSKAAHVVNIIKRDSAKHESPNSGLPEAGYAAALNIQLGGDSYYGGELYQRPLLGDKGEEINREHILRAIRLLYRIMVALLGLAFVFRFIFALLSACC